MHRSLTDNMDCPRSSVEKASRSQRSGTVSKHVMLICYHLLVPLSVQRSPGGLIGRYISSALKHGSMHGEQACRHNPLAPPPTVQGLQDVEAWRVNLVKS